MSVKLVIKQLDFCSVLMWWTGHSVGFLNVFCVLFYCDFPDFCPCLNGRVCRTLISGQCRPSCMLFILLRSCELYHTLPQKDCKWVSVSHTSYIVLIFQACVICFLQMMLNPLGISLDPSRSRLQMTTDITRQIYIRDGVRGFYRGYVASLCTYVPNSALWWAFYDLYQGNY